MNNFIFDPLFFNSYKELKSTNLDRNLKIFKRINKKIIVHKKKKLLNFSSNDYLGLSTNKYLKKETIKIINKFGIGTCSSRLITGSYDLHDKIEKHLSKMKKTEDSLIFSTGYLANYSILSTILNSNIFKKNPVVFSDKFNHNCIYEGCKSSKVQFNRFKHNDLNHLEYLLKKNQNNSNPRFILSETIFSMDGDIADIKGLIFLKKKYKAFLFLDEAHATGLFGKNGFGLSVDFGREIDCVTGTFSKALGCFGAYVACSKKLKKFLINKCSSFIYSTSLPFSILGSIYASIKIIPKLQNERKELFKNASFVRKSLNKEGFNIGNSKSHIIPLIIGNTEKTILVSRKLYKKNFYLSAIRPPTVPQNTSRLRISLSSFHTKNDIKKLIKNLIIFEKEIGLNE